MTIASDVLGAYRRWLHIPDPGPLYALLGAIAANRLAGDPFLLMLVATSGWGKSEFLKPFLALPECHHASSPTKAGLLSGSNGSGDGGLLHRMGDYGIIVFPDLTSLLAGAHESVSDLIGAIQEITGDGGYSRPVGTNGGEPREWHGKAGFIACITGSHLDRHYAGLAGGGQRWCFYRLPRFELDAQRVKMAAAWEHLGASAGEMRDELVEAVTSAFVDNRYLGEAPPELTVDEMAYCEVVAGLGAPGRTVVVRTGHNREAEDDDEPEDPTRLALQLGALTAGLRAVGVVGDEARHVVAEAGMGGIPRLRRSVLELLCTTPAGLLTSAVTDAVSATQARVGRALEDLFVAEVVERHSQNDRQKLWMATPEAKQAWATIYGEPDPVTLTGNVTRLMRRQASAATTERCTECGATGVTLYGHADRRQCVNCEDF